MPADWVVLLPANLFAVRRDGTGTAGLTAALGIVRMEENGLTPAKGPVIVTGATGVGSLAVDMLAQRGYHVVALTGKASEADYLRELGASEVLLRQDLDLSKIRPLDSGRWAGAVDNLGGDYLAWIASTMLQGGTIASIGLASSMKLNTTVAPSSCVEFPCWESIPVISASLIVVVFGSVWQAICGRRTWQR